MPLTLTQLQTQAQLLAADTASTLAAASYTTLINEAYIWYRDAVDTRTQFQSSTTLFGGSWAGSIKTKKTTPTNIRKILGLFVQAATGDTVPTAQMIRLEMNEIPDSTSSTEYTLQRDPADGGKWTVYLGANTSGTTYIAGVVVLEITALSAGGDTPDLSDHECYIIARLAAIQASRILGRDDSFIQNLAATLPQEVKDAANMEDFLRKPRSRPQEEAF